MAGLDGRGALHSPVPNPCGLLFAFLTVRFVSMPHTAHT